MDAREEVQVRKRLQLTNQEIGVLKEKKTRLELELTNEQFHYDHFDQRKNLEGGKVLTHFSILIPLMVVVIVAIIVFIFCVYSAVKGDRSAFIGIGMLASLLITIFGGYAVFRLWKIQFGLLKSFYSLTEMLHYKRGIEPVTIRLEEQRSRERLEKLHSEIRVLDDELARLFKEKEKMEADIGSLNFWANEKEEALKVHAKDTIEPAKSDGKVKEHKNSEILYLEGEIAKLKEEIEKQKQEHIRIINNYELAKNRTIMFLIIFVSAIVLQFICKTFAPLHALFGWIGMIISILYIIRLIRYYTQWFIEYLVEQKSDLMQEYSFVHDVYPTNQTIKKLEKEIDFIKDKIEWIEKSL